MAARVVARAAALLLLRSTGAHRLTLPSLPTPQPSLPHRHRPPPSPAPHTDTRPQPQQSPCSAEVSHSAACACATSWIAAFVASDHRAALTASLPPLCCRSVCRCAADEVGALVLDLGTQFSKAGYAGEDTPKAVFHTVRRHRLGASAAPISAAAVPAASAAHTSVAGALPALLLLSILPGCWQCVQR